MIDGMIMFILGSYFWAVGTGHMALSKDPMKNAAALARFGPVWRIVGPIVTIAACS
jgi:hypothetical protein